MKITIKVRDVKIIIDETETSYKANIKYEKDAEVVHNTIKVMVDQCLRLLKQ